MPETGRQSVFDRLYNAARSSGTSSRRTATVTPAPRAATTRTGTVRETPRQQQTGGRTRTNPVRVHPGESTTTRATSVQGHNSGSNTLSPPITAQNNTDKRSKRSHIFVAGNRSKGISDTDAAPHEITNPATVSQYRNDPKNAMERPKNRSVQDTKTRLMDDLSTNMRQQQQQDGESDQFIYHGHGTRGGQLKMGETAWKSNQKTQDVAFSGREFASAVASGLEGQDKDKKRQFTFQTCWSALDKKNKNAVSGAMSEQNKRANLSAAPDKSLIQDFTEGMVKAGFSNFSVEGSRTALNTTGALSFGNGSSDLRTESAGHGREEKPFGPFGIPDRTATRTVTTGNTSSATENVKMRDTFSVPDRKGITDIQRVFRGHKARKEVTQMKKKQEHAATDIQRVFKGYQARKAVNAQKQSNQQSMKSDKPSGR